MKIGLDYDGTWTADPDFWLAFALHSRMRGHEVYLTTMRFPSECESTLVEAAHNGKPQIHFDPRIEANGITVFATGRTAKDPFCRERGIVIDVWIDDNPKAVHMHVNQIWPEEETNKYPEGQPFDPYAEKQA